MKKDNIKIKKDDFINLQTTIDNMKTNLEASRIALDGLFEVADDINESFKKKVGVGLYACKELGYHLALILNTYKEFFKDVDAANKMIDKLNRQASARSA